MNFVLLAWMTFLTAGTYHPRQIVVLALVTLWGVRLGGFLLYRVLLRGKDDRFDEMRAHFFQFLGFWIAQIIWVWVVSLPVTFLMTARVDQPLGALDYVGWTLFGIGFIFESLADFSKQAHHSDKSKKDDFLHENVWSISRHPNYFGEITLWLGIFLSACSVFDANDKAGYVAVASPLLTAILLLFVSGAPLGEERSDKKFGAVPAYRSYKKNTSPIVPMPQSVYAQIPQFIRAFFLCEFPMYNKVDLEKQPTPEQQKKKKKEKEQKEKEQKSGKGSDMDDDSPKEKDSDSKKHYQSQDNKSDL